MTFPFLKSCKFQNPIFLASEKEYILRLKKIAHLKKGHLILLERANFGLWGDITSAENRVPPPCHLMSPFGGTPSLPLWGDVIYGWSLNFFSV